MLGGLDSEAITGTVHDFGPIPSPNASLETNRCCHEFVTADQMHVAKDKKEVIIIVPLLPKNLFRGEVNQQPRTAQQR